MQPALRKLCKMQQISTLEAWRTAGFKAAPRNECALDARCPTMPAGRISARRTCEDVFLLLKVVPAHGLRIITAGRTAGQQGVAMHHNNICMETV